MNTTLRKIGNLAGLLGPIVWTVTIVYSATQRPDYSHFTQYISELGERGSITEWPMRYGAFIATGFLYSAFAAYLYVTFRGHRWAVFAAFLVLLNGVARFGAGFFPCDPGCDALHPSLIQKLHSLSATIGYCALIGSSILYGVILRRYEDVRGMSWFSIVAGISSATFLFLMVQSVDTRDGTGMYQRLSTVMMSLWLIAFSGRLWQLNAYNLARTRLQRIS